MFPSFNKCVAKKPLSMNPTEIKQCINKLIFRPEKFQKDKELMTLVVLGKKAHKFKFLQGSTRWNAIGTWQEMSPEGKIIKKYPHEKNVSIEVEYKDYRNKVSPKLQELFRELNKREIKERLLYTRFSKLEHSSL